MVFDQDRCIGCEACRVACRIENNTSIFWITVKTQGEGQKDVPSGKYPNLEINFLPQLCNHCKKPPCVESCPNEALIKRDDGIVVIDEDVCDRCEACISACPYGVIKINEEKNIIEKCNFCSHRIDRGLEPFCVMCCEGQAIFFGDLNEPKGKLLEMISKRKVFQLKPEENTEPSIYYCHPRPKRIL
jgi:Fe-S-cluster-containing dehydrogenase component